LKEKNHTIFKSTEDPFQSVFPKKALWPLD